jgi:hypothetical protein
VPRIVLPSRATQPRPTAAAAAAGRNDAQARHVDVAGLALPRDHALAELLRLAADEQALDVEHDNADEASGGGGGGATATLDERLAQLQLASGVPAVVASRGAALRADSLQSMLVQALRADDRALLESVLAVADARIITNTVRRLPVHSILPFFNAVVARFHSRPTRAASLVRWLRAVLLQHAAFLASLPDLVSVHFPSIHLYLSMYIYSML